MSARAAMSGSGVATQPACGGVVVARAESAAALLLGRASLQEQARDLEEEVAVLRNLSHPNIVVSSAVVRHDMLPAVTAAVTEAVALPMLAWQARASLLTRYLGTDREEEALNIFLEFVPGGSIASLLSKFGSFTEKVIRMYTRQLLLGLDYLHTHQIMHRDIKGANILVDNRGCIKLADFGASKKLADLATMSEGFKSMKGTPYWMAPEVIKQTGHGRQADIWSVACTVIEMATGKPPWSQFQSQAGPPIMLCDESHLKLTGCHERYRLRMQSWKAISTAFGILAEVAVSALFHIAASKAPPPIPDHLSPEAKDFLLKCFRRDPRERPPASELLKAVLRWKNESVEGHKAKSESMSRVLATSIKVPLEDGCSTAQSRQYLRSYSSPEPGVDLDDGFSQLSFQSNFNPMEEPSMSTSGASSWRAASHEHSEGLREWEKGSNSWHRRATAATPLLASPRLLGPVEPKDATKKALALDDDEVTEDKIMVFLKDKAQELRVLQTPLLELYQSIRNTPSPVAVRSLHDSPLERPIAGHSGRPAWQATSPIDSPSSRGTGSFIRAPFEDQGLEHAQRKASGAAAVDEPALRRHAAEVVEGRGDVAPGQYAEPNDASNIVGTREWSASSSSQHETHTRADRSRGGLLSRSESGALAKHWKDAPAAMPTPTSACRLERANTPLTPPADRQGDANSSYISWGAVKQQQWQEELQRELASRREEVRRRHSLRHSSAPHQQPRQASRLGPTTGP
eukprot:SM000098S25130  [mRNA]  locus=s98:364693:369983:- [translate_table: standard]